MHKSLLILVLAVSFISAVLFTKATIQAYEWINPAFTKEEASALIGRKVTCALKTDNNSLVRCPAKGDCEDIQQGEQGKVIGIKEQANGGYFLVVRWNNAPQDHVTYLGRTTYREYAE